MRSKQKKIKFSKGQINSRLLERQDLDVLDSSARLVKNYISTPFGSIRSRGGTENIAKINSGKTALSTPTITNSIGGTDASLYNETALFVSDGIEGDTTWFKYDFGSSQAIYKVYTENIYFSFTAPVLTPVIVDGVITGVTISTAGIGLNSVTLTVTDILGEDADLTATVNSAGTITGVTVTDGGTGYSSKTAITVNYTKPSETVTLQGSLNDSTWTDLDTYSITSTTTDFVTTVSANYRYLRVVGAGVLATKVNLYNVRAYSLVAGSTTFKLVDFVFNQDQKYLLVLKDEEILVYEDDSLIDTVTATGLVDTLFDTLKIAQAEDTMVFTHPDLKTRQLVRTTGPTFTFGDFPFTNIPNALFGAETVVQPAQTLTPSATEGSIKLTSGGGTIFSSASVGQLIDGGGGRVRITEYESATIVYGYTVIPFYTTSAIASGEWDYITGYEAVWSVTRGYPTTCMFYQQRLWFGGSKSKPNTIWASRVGQYNDFDNVGNYANDGINATISSQQIDEIVNIYANRGIQVFTAGAEWIVPEGATTPDTFTITKNTSNGSLSSVNVVDIAGTTLFVEKNGKSLLGFVYQEGQAAFMTSSLSLLTDLIQGPIGMAVDHNSSADIGNFLYMPMADGTMVTWCIILDQKIQSPVTFDSANNGLVKEVVNVAGDTYILVDRKDEVYLEKLLEPSTVGNVDMLTTDNTLSASITGLDDYTGSYVRVYNSTTDFGTYYVIDGDITLSSTPASAVNIGLVFDYEMKSNKIAINGQTENIEKRISKATVVTNDTTSLTFSGQTLEQSDDVYDLYGVTGFMRDCYFTMSGSFDYAEILSILLNINYGEK